MIALQVKSRQRHPAAHLRSLHLTGAVEEYCGRPQAIDVSFSFSKRPPRVIIARSVWRLWYAKVGPMDKQEKVEAQHFETVEPIGKRVLIRKDEDKKQTKGGIQLPDNIEIPTITGRVVAVSAEIENSHDIPLRKYDKVLFNPKDAIPVDFEGDNRLFVVEVTNVVAVFRKS
jgi:chaperonin GroES